jgi:hypothetical protein
MARTFLAHGARVCIADVYAAGAKKLETDLGGTRGFLTTRACLRQMRAQGTGRHP